MSGCTGRILVFVTLVRLCVLSSCRQSDSDTDTVSQLRELRERMGELVAMQQEQRQTCDEQNDRLEKQVKDMKAELQRQQDEMEILRKDMKREQLRSDALRKAVAQKSSEVESLRQPLPGRFNAGIRMDTTLQGNAKSAIVQERKEFTGDVKTTRTPGLNTTRAGKMETHIQRRSDDIGSLEPVIGHMTQQIAEMTSDIQALQNEPKGTTYVRWGHAACPGSAALVYTGILAGMHYYTAGGGANHLCLTSNPVFDNHPIPSGQAYSEIFGSEYDICPETECQLTPACAVCRIPRPSFVMVPGTTHCPTGWTTEYSGYIMGGYHGQPGSSEYICVDASHGYIHTSQADDNQNIIYYTVARCGSLPCPPYVDQKVLSCVVCSM